MNIKNKKILIFVADHYEDLELHYPRLRLQEAGAAKVLVAGPEKGNIYKGKHGYPVQTDLSFDEVDVNQFDALIIPGSYAPDLLRTIPKVLEITKQFDSQKKLVAFICHAGWVPISAQILHGVKATSYKAIKDDMINAGVEWMDAPVVIDRHFISSRFPPDLPHFCAAIIQYLDKSGS